MKLTGEESGNEVRTEFQNEGLFSDQWVAKDSYAGAARNQNKDDADVTGNSLSGPYRRGNYEYYEKRASVQTAGPSINRDRREVDRERETVTGASSESGMLSMAKKSAIFVSRLEPRTEVRKITEALSVLKLNVLEIKRLKTNFDTYASFHVLDLDEDRDRLLNPLLWAVPLGCVISRWFGKLYSDRLIDSDSSREKEGGNSRDY